MLGWCAGSITDRKNDTLETPNTQPLWPPSCSVEISLQVAYARPVVSASSHEQANGSHKTSDERDEQDVTKVTRNDCQQENKPDNRENEL